MKNMTLPAKSCSIILCTLLLFAAGCNEKNKPESFTGNVERPTWTAPADYDYSSSMTAVVKVDLKAQYPETGKDFVLNNSDLVAAFSGETCLGTASPQDDLFFLYIAGTEGAITLRYYSAHYKNLFEAKDAFPFVNDDHLGTVAEPLIPQFVIGK